jgi:hypothetical protein
MLEPGKRLPAHASQQKRSIKLRSIKLPCIEQVEIYAAVCEVGEIPCRGFPLG